MPPGHWQEEGWWHRAGDPRVSPRQPQAVPDLSHGDMVPVQPALGWQVEPPEIWGPESLPASRCLQFIIFPKYYYTIGTTDLLFTDPSVPSGSPC